MSLLEADARADERLVISNRLERMGIEMSKSREYSANDTTIRSQALYEASKIISGYQWHLCDIDQNGLCFKSWFHV